MPYGRSVTGPAVATELVSLFKHQLSMCKLEKGEDCLIITDTAFDPTYAAAFLGAGLALEASTQIVTLPYSIPAIPKSLAAALGHSDLIIAVTTHPLHYREELRRALDGGTRALMAVQPLHVLHRLPADPAVIARTKQGAQLLDSAKTIRITSPHGTDLTMEKGGRPGLAHYGAADRPGHFDFWGAAMVEAAQLEGTLEGTLVLATGDSVFHLGRFIEEPVTIQFSEGRVVSISGGLDAFLLREHLASYEDPNALVAGHMAWGTDHRAIWTAPLVQFPEIGAGNADSEGYYGNIQIQIGSNNDQFFRGKNSSRAHLGLCTLGSSLYLDGEIVIRDGQIIDSPIERAVQPWL